MVHTYVAPRPALYSFLWVASVIELGLTAYRVHHTKSVASFYDPIVVELLVTSILTFLYVPIAIYISHRTRPTGATVTRSPYGSLHGETAGIFTIWILWLVGAAVATHKWPNTFQVGTGKQGHILLTIVAFAWISFAVFTIVQIFVLMHYAALNAVASLRAGGSGPGVAVHEKPPVSAPVTV